MKKIIAIKTLLIILVVALSIGWSNNANAQCSSCGSSCSGYEVCDAVDTPTQSCSLGCGCFCSISITLYHKLIRQFTSKVFKQHHDWMIDTFFIENIGLAMAQMTSQLSTVSMQQMKIIGTFFDAKHQLETQRLFQQLMAEAHKDYQPSEGMCDIGTNVRGLATGERKSNLAHLTLANRVMSRQLRTGNNLSEGKNTDLLSRIDMFRNNFCSKSDNANGLRNICAGVDAPGVTINTDVDFTRTIETPLTLEIDFSAGGLGEPTNDEKASFALMANLFAHDTIPSIGNRILSDEDGNPRVAAYKYMDLRAVTAKRSVAQNSISAIIAERARGDSDTDYGQFLRSVILELGVGEIDIPRFTGINPSYFSQMEILTKKLYQNPTFYTELYDKPTNVLRKRAAIRAIGLMQDRDLYKSLLRSEAVLSVVLETMLNDEHDNVYQHLNRLEPAGEPIHE